MNVKSSRMDLDEVIFQAAMYWRIGYGVVRIYIGYIFLHLIGVPAIEVYRRLFRNELTDDPHDHILRVVTHTLTQHGFSITYFLAAHFLFWGVIDIVLSYTMIRHHLWAFKTSIVVIIFFMFYEIYRFTHTHSLILLGFIFTDIFFVYLIRHEFEKLKVRKARALAKERENDRQAGNNH